MIDLHTHTTESDGSLTPPQLLAEAERVGLEALAITDHDTFAGYDQAAALHPAIDLVCGIELSTTWEGRSTHLLAYFPERQPAREFREWISSLIYSRRERNEALVEKLRDTGFGISMQDMETRAGSMICRPHFAAVMLEKGYVESIQEAFDRYLGESGACFTPRHEVEFEDAVARVAAAGGLPVLAHPGRLTRDPHSFGTHIERMRAAGLTGIEVYHSDHSAADQSAWAEIAHHYSLVATGGSDFHGANKPNVHLGTGVNLNVNVPRAVLDQLRCMA